MGQHKPGASRTMSIIKMMGIAWRAADEHGHLRCSYCRQEINFGEADPEHTGTMDHVDPQAADLNDPGNVVAACRICNVLAGDHSQDHIDGLSDRLDLMNLDPGEVYRDVEAQLREPINLDKGHELAERYYPERMAYLREAARERGQRARAHDLDALDLEIPF